MGFKEWIVPQDRAFFNWIDEAIKNADATADALVQMLKNYQDVAARRQAIKDLEHRGDKITHSLFDALSRSFITPIDREDIAALAKGIDDITDYIYAATNRLYLYEITKPTPEMVKFAEIIKLQTVELIAALHEIRSPKTRATATRHAIEVHRLENEADRLLNEAVAALFRGSDPIHILKHKEILEILETGTDLCEDVADVISDVVRKHQ